MRRYVLFIIMISLMFSGCLFPQTVEFDSMDEFDEQYVLDLDEEHLEFISDFDLLDAGDTAKIDDTIESIHYLDTLDETYIKFISSLGTTTFEGDLTQDFEAGNSVVITYHIIGEKGMEYIKENNDINVIEHSNR